MKARRFIVSLCAAYEALRLFALYLLLSVLFPGDFAAGLGALLLVAAMPALAVVALLVAAGRYAELWHPVFVAYRVYKGLSIPVWGYLMLSLLSGPILEPQILLALAALGVVDVVTFLLSFLAPGEQSRGEQEDGQESEGADNHPRHEEIEVD